MIRWLYNFCFPLAFIILLPGYLRRMFRRGNFRRHFWQRLGYFPRSFRARLAAGPPRPWLQAVSVGEMLVALKVIAALRQREPDLPLILSTTTTTGFQLAEERAPANVDVIYTPIDALGAVRRAYRALRPSQLVIVDGGLWPNQLWEAKRRKIPTALVNARMSPRSERRFHRFHPLSAGLFQMLDLVAVATENDLERWLAVGVAPTNLRLTGSVKFDHAEANRISAEASAELHAVLALAGVRTGAPILLAGSTHPGEERILGQIFLRLRRRYPGLFLIVAPRHVERSPAVRSELESLGLRVLNRTRRVGARADSDVLLLDTTGELRDWYSVASLVFIGKSLAAKGGQNPAEAVAAGKPVVFGPHMENFADFVTSLLAVRAAVQVRDVEELEAACANLLGDPAAAQTMSDGAGRLLDAHRGAAGRTADLVLEQVKNSPC